MGVYYYEEVGLIDVERELFKFRMMIELIKAFKRRYYENFSFAMNKRLFRTWLHIVCQAQPENQQTQ